jgi:hypothetical protein
MLLRPLRYRMLEAWQVEADSLAFDADKINGTHG